MLFFRIWLFSFLVLPLVDGCFEPRANDGSRSPCSSGPDYPPDASFPTVTEESSGYPECVPRCGASRPFTLNALPSGACGVDGERCRMDVNTFCPPDGRLGRVDAMRCICSSGAWSCAITSQGGGICPAVDSGASDFGGLDAESGGPRR